MMQTPPVQYVRTSDGVSIAYTVQGEGPALVVLPFGFSHAQHVWQTSSATPLLQALARRFRVVYFDQRGQGLSQRGLPETTSIASFLLDLEAVLDALFLQPVVLFGDGPRSHIAVRFAAENPQRVSALALMHCATSAAHNLAGLTAMAKANWDYFLQIQAGATVPRGPDDMQRLTNRVEELRARTTQQDFVRASDVLATSDITDVLPKLRVPTIVLHPTHQQWVGQELAARTAALIPNGRLVVLESPAFFGDEEAAGAIERLVAESAGERDGSPPSRHTLSLREVEVLKLIAEGRSNKEIAADLSISLNTVTRHVSNIYGKAGVTNRAMAANYARAHGLL